MTKAARIRGFLAQNPGLTTGEVSEALGISAGYVSMVKSNLKYPTGNRPKYNPASHVKTVVSDWFLDSHGCPTRLIQGVAA